MQRVHFVGVSGIGMSAVAEITMASGMTASGSALEENKLTRRLTGLGLTFFRGHLGSHVEGSEAVVMSAAVPENNPEIVEARRSGIPVYLYAEYLGRLMKDNRGIAVAGTHGKTTTTAMIATIAHRAGLSPTAVCGGVMKAFGSNALVGTGDLFIAEACEYKRSFLHLPKHLAVVTNIEPEHLDYYSGLNDISEAFKTFMETTEGEGLICVNGDDVTVRDVVETVGDGVKVLRVGHKKDNGYGVQMDMRERGRYRVKIEGENFATLTIDLPIPGRFNGMNAALAAVSASSIGIGHAVIKDALEHFEGIERRLELLASQGDHLVFSDYAHHPTEIEATLQALREEFPRKTITLIFQPHQYSRTKHFFYDFVRVLQKTDRLVLTEVYRQRDGKDADLLMNSALLYEELRPLMGERVVFIEDKGNIPVFLREREGREELFLFMGAGDIDEVAQEFSAAP